MPTWIFFSLFCMDIVLQNAKWLLLLVLLFKWLKGRKKIFTRGAKSVS